MRYFGGKAGLLEALFDDAWDHLNARIEKAVQPATDHTEAILDAVQALVTMLARDADLATLLMFEGRRMRGSAPRVRVAREFVTFTEKIHGLVTGAQTAGQIDPTRDTAAVTSALLGAAESLIRDRLVAKSTGARTFAERDIRRTLAGMIRGLRPVHPAARTGAKKR